MSAYAILFQDLARTSLGDALTRVHMTARDIPPSVVGTPHQQNHLPGWIQNRRRASYGNTAPFTHAFTTDDSNHVFHPFPAALQAQKTSTALRFSTSLGGGISENKHTREFVLENSNASLCA